MVPEADSAQPPYIHDQAELEILLRGEPAIDLSNGSLHLRDGRPMPPGSAYWLHLGYERFFTLELVAPDGVLIWTYPWLPPNPRGAAKELAQIAHEELWHRALLELKQVPDELRFDGHFEVATEAELASVQGRPAVSFVERVQGEEYGVLTGAQREAQRGRSYGVTISLVVDNPSPHPLHLAVLSVGEDRHHALVFPPLNTERSATRLEPGASQRLLVSVGRDYLSDWDRPSRPDRAMRDRFFLIASREAHAYRSFHDDCPPAIGEEGSPLERWVARNLDEMGGLLEEPRVGPSALDGTQVGVSYVDLIVN